MGGLGTAITCTPQFAGPLRDVRSPSLSRPASHRRRVSAVRSLVTYAMHTLQQDDEKVCRASILAGHGSAPPLQINSMHAPVAQGHALRMTISASCPSVP